MTDPDRVVAGVDVGTGSARAGIFALDGVLLGRGERPIALWQRGDHVEQSSADIWDAVCGAVRDARAAAGVAADAVAGIGFDATCSLVALDRDGAPVTVSADGDDARNVIVWMDHRAVEDAVAIDATHHRVLQFVGGSISPEMETPKLRWVKRNLPDTWRRVAHWFDLVDFLTWRASGSARRSLCTMVCKWTYLGHEHRFDPSYFGAIGLEDLAADGFTRIGTDVSVPGSALGTLRAHAAAGLGLAETTVVGVGLIDAHAGALGMIGAAGSPVPAERRLAIIAGTSACHLAVSTERRDVPGVWGPYWEALLPDRWLAEAGISASGAFLEHAMRSHPAFAALGPEAFAVLDSRIAALAPDPLDAAALTSDLHLQPNLLGNRAPLADPTLTGGVAGWRLRDDVDDLARWYLAALQALAYATRHLAEALTDAGFEFDLVVACGGSAANEWWLRSHADALGLPIAVPAEADAVLLGAAMLGATAAGMFATPEAAMTAMTRLGRVVEPDRRTAAYHDAKYRVYRRMVEDHDAYRALMAEC